MALAHSPIARSATSYGDIRIDVTEHASTRAAALQTQCSASPDRSRQPPRDRTRIGPALRARAMFEHGHALRRGSMIISRSGARSLPHLELGQLNWVRNVGVTLGPALRPQVASEDCCASLH